MRVTFDAAARVSARRLDENGFLHVAGCPISTHGIFDYARSEADLPGDPNEIVKVLRPASTLTDEVFLASCQNMPLLYKHTYLEGITEDADSDESQGMDPDKKGVVGVMSNVHFDEGSGWLLADLTFYSRALIRQILQDKSTELSLGYTGVFTPVEGQEHKAVQEGFRCNHLAVVDSARVPGARVLDSVTPTILEDVKMKKKVLDGAAVEKLREILLPALQQFLAESSEGEAAPAAAEPVAEPTAEPAAPVADPAAAVEAGGEEVDVEAEPATADGDDDSAITGLLQQLLSALGGGTATGDEESAEKTEIGDEDDTKCGDEEATKCGDDDVEADVEADVEGTEPAVTMDQMFVAVAQRDKLADRLSRVVGTFDHAAMSPSSVTAYGLKKLGLTAKAGAESIVLDAYLSGVERSVTTKTKTADSKVLTEVDAYLAGK